MAHSHPLGTARLILRPARDAELDAVEARLADRDGPSLPAQAARRWFEPAVSIHDLGRTAVAGRLCLALEERTTGELVGLAELVVPAPDGVPWIGLLVIVRDRRNLGLGGEAATALERLFAAQGWPEVRLAVDCANAGARRFWERQGFREVRDAWRRYDGLTPASIVCSKRLLP